MLIRASHYEHLQAINCKTNMLLPELDTEDKQ